MYLITMLQKCLDMVEKLRSMKMTLQKLLLKICLKNGLRRMEAPMKILFHWMKVICQKKKLFMWIRKDRVQIWTLVV